MFLGLHPHPVHTNSSPFFDYTVVSLLLTPRHPLLQPLLPTPLPCQTRLGISGTLLLEFISSRCWSLKFSTETLIGPFSTTTKYTQSRLSFQKPDSVTFLYNGRRPFLFSSSKPCMIQTLQIICRLSFRM